MEVLHIIAIYLLLTFMWGYIDLFNTAPYWIIRPRIEEKALKEYKKYIRSLKWQEQKNK